jgi:hypothetical protein
MIQGTLLWLFMPRRAARTGALAIRDIIMQRRFIVALLATTASMFAGPASAQIVINPVSGNGASGVASTPIWDIAAGVLVNGVPLTFGALGNANAALAMVGEWPTGFRLRGDGAVTTTAAVQAGVYILEYEICALTEPPVCALSTATVTMTPAQQFVEQSVSPNVIGEIEFDWGRDGLYCASCNFGAGNSRLTWTDRDSNLWVSGVDPATGAFEPINGEGTGTPVSTTAYFWSEWGSGPQWAVSTPPGAPSNNPVSQLVYTRFAPGETPVYEWTGAALATQIAASAWETGFLPGAYAPNTINTVAPQPSQCPSDARAYAIFETLGDPGNPGQREFTEPVSRAAGTMPTQVPVSASGSSANDRWVPCTTALTFEAAVTTGTQTSQQVFWYDRITQNVQQLTFDAASKQGAQLFRAPDYGGNYLLITVAANDTLQIYEQLNGATYPSGAPVMTLLANFNSPDPVEPYFVEPQAFIHCTAEAPTCQTYLVVGLSEAPNSQETVTQPNGLALMSLNPAQQSFMIMAAAQSTPAAQRLNPAYFITSQNGPVLMYDRALTQSTTQRYLNQGMYQINLQLGAPSGPCVGSSASGGLNPTWPNCTPGMPP